MTFRAAVLLLLLIAAAWMPVPVGAAAAPTFGQYVHAVHHVRQALDRLPDSSASSPGVIDQIQGELRALSVVRLPDGRILRTESATLSGELAPDPASVRSLRGEIDALDTGLRVLPQRPANAEDLGELDAVMLDHRFQPTCTPVQCVMNWVGAKLQSLNLQSGLTFPGLPSVVVWVFAVSFLLVIAALGVLIARGALKRAVVNVLPSASPGRIDPAATRAQADEAASRGDYRSALHFLFVATLLTLHRRNGLELRAGLTNRELLRALRDTGSTALVESSRRQAFEELVDAFDRAWYGHLPFSADEYARCRRLADLIVAHEGRDAA